MQNQDAFIRRLRNQIVRRIQGFDVEGINPLQQKIVLDMRGQPATWNQLNNLAQRVARETGLPQTNVQVVTW